MREDAESNDRIDMVGRKAAASAEALNRGNPNLKKAESNPRSRDLGFLCVIQSGEAFGCGLQKDSFWGI